MAEPSRLGWGNQWDRRVLGLALILGGGIALQGASPYILWLLAVGAVAHALGWALQPTDGWRRIAAGAASSIAIWLVLTGPQSLWLLCVPFAGWLLVRKRPLPAWSSILLPLVAGIVLAVTLREYSWMPWALPIQLGVLVVAAWVAAAISALVDRRSRTPRA